MVGKYRWGIAIPKQKECEYVLADDVLFVDGALVFVNDKFLPIFVYAKGKWDRCFAASMFTGDAIALD